MIVWGVSAYLAHPAAAVMLSRCRLTRMTITRRSFVKGAVVAGGLAWTAPAIESFTARAAAASGVPHTCCQCYGGSLIPNTLVFVTAAVDDFTPTSCADLCATVGVAERQSSGFYVLFTGGPAEPFTASNSGASLGCSAAGTYLGGKPLCLTSTSVAGVDCTSGTWPPF